MIWCMQKPQNNVFLGAAIVFWYPLYICSLDILNNGPKSNENARLRGPQPNTHCNMSSFTWIHLHYHFPFLSPFMTSYVTSIPCLEIWSMNSKVKEKGQINQNHWQCCLTQAVLHSSLKSCRKIIISISFLKWEGVLIMAASSILPIHYRDINLHVLLIM